MRSDPPPPPAAPLTPFAASPPNHCWPLSESSRETAVGGSVAPSEVLEKEASLSASSPAGGQRGEAHRSVEPASMRVDGRTVSPPHRQSITFSMISVEAGNAILRKLAQAFEAAVHPRWEELKARANQSLKDGDYDAAAAVTQQLEIDKRRHTELQMLDAPYMTIRQAMGLPKTRGPETATFLTSFVVDLKQADFISDAISKHRVDGATVAPPEYS